MSDDFEDLLKRWLRDRAGNDRSALQALAGNVAALPPRRQRRLGPLVSLAASVAVLLGLLVFASPRFGGVGNEASPDAGSSPSEKSTEPAASNVPPNLIPMWAVNLAGQLDCDGPVARIGGESPESFGGPDTLNNSADDALAVFLGPSNPFASIPTAGYTQLHAEPHWASFGHLVDGRPKAIVLLTDTTEHGPGWQVAGLRACDASEFDPTVPLTFPVTIWTDELGNRISTETIRSMPGPGHCGWDSVTWLRVEETVYFRDPQGVMAEWTATSFALNAQLPPSAIDSGYRSGGGSLWLDPGRDAYVVSADRVERWPRSSDPLIGCM
jgi:hypothetical protein